MEFYDIRFQKFPPRKFLKFRYRVFSIGASENRCYGRVPISDGVSWSGRKKKRFETENVFRLSVFLTVVGVVSLRGARGTRFARNVVYNRNVLKK